MSIKQQEKIFVGKDTFVGTINIYETKDYDKFKFLACNRFIEVNDKKVKKLVEAIRKENRLKKNPIEVNGKGFVIDGQHRLRAARILECPIYYTVDLQAVDKDIIKKNTGRNIWKTADFIHYYLTKGTPGYAVLEDIQSKYPQARISTLTVLLSGITDRNDLMEDLKEGKLNLSHTKEAIKVLDICQDLYDKGIKHAFERSHILAMNKIIKTGKYVHEILARKIKYNISGFVKCADTAMYIRKIEEMYNYKTPSQDKVQFESIINKS